MRRISQSFLIYAIGALLFFVALASGETRDFFGFTRVHRHGYVIAASTDGYLCEGDRNWVDCRRAVSPPWASRRFSPIFFVDKAPDMR
jgi:hypothetical protein